MADSSSSLELTMRGRILLWLAALSACAAWLGEDATIRLAAALLSAPILVDLALKQRRLHETELRIEPRRTIANARFTEQVVLRHVGRHRLRECLLIEPRTMGVEPPVLLPTLRPGQPRRITYPARSRTRSHVIERVFILTTVWPLGLFRTRSVLARKAELVTEPSRVRLPRDVLASVADREAVPRDRSILGGPEFHSLREHHPDEDSRGVHALRSASLGILVRRVTRGRTPRTIGIVLDLRRPPGLPLEGGRRRFEWSLGACATLLTNARARGSDVDLVVLDSEPTRILVQERATELEVLTLLAEASPARHRTAPPNLLHSLRRHEHCYWIPAGSYRATSDLRTFPVAIRVLGEAE